MKKTEENKYADVNSLLEKAENTKFTLKAKQESGRLARYFDEMAESAYEEISGYFGEMRRDFYASRIKSLNRERLEHMDRIGRYIKEDFQKLEALTDVKEKIETLDEITSLLIEISALIDQSYRKPWTMCI